MRGFPGLITRRQVTTAVIVVATGGLATVAVAAGPVVYSEYTTGGDRENRVVREDGTGDVALPKDVMGAAVSPDGKRIAQTTLETDRNAEEPFRSTLRVTAGDGSAPTTLLEERPAKDESVPERIITGTPVWSPDGTRVLVLRVDVDGGSLARRTRVICEVDARRCRTAGVAAGGADDYGSDWQRSDVVAWPVAAGPVVQDAPRHDSRRIPRRVRCGTGGRTLKGPTVRLRGLPGSSFGPPLVLTGLTEEAAPNRIASGTVGAVAVADGLLVHDRPQAAIRRGRLSCSSSDYPGFRERHSVGTARLRVRAGTRTRTLPVPPGLRRGDGVRLVGTDTGGAILIATASPARTEERICIDRSRKSVRNCRDDVSYAVSEPRPTPLRVWRYVAGASPRFERVTTARRSALRALAAADDFAVASGDAVLVVTEGSIERVPLDGGAPIVIARGRQLSLDLSAW